MTRVLGDLVARQRRRDAPALRVPVVDRQYDYRRFCTTAWKTGNFLRHLGVRTDTGVLVAADPLPEPVFALFGTALLGGTVQFRPFETDHDVGAETRSGSTHPRVAVLPTARLAAITDDRIKRVAYGTDPGTRTVSYFERDVWSENPTAPPDRVAPETPVLGTATGTRHTHAAVLRAAHRVATEWELEPPAVGTTAATIPDDDVTVAVRTPLTQPGTIVAGLVVPLLVGGTVVFPDGETVADAAVTDTPATAPESVTVTPAAAAPAPTTDGTAAESARSDNG